MKPGRCGRAICLAVVSAGVLVAGCGRVLKGPADPLAGLLPGGPRSQSLLVLRAYLPRVVTCPSTIELTENGVSWVDIQSCRPTDLRRGVRFKDIQEARLMWQKVHMGRDERWLEVMHNKSWLPIGRGVGGGIGGLGGKERIRVLETLKGAFERLGPGRETPNQWKARARPYLF
ncbi:MAG: hypothetical protein ACE5IM_07560 [Nitrospinota bacterium]